MPPRRIVRTAKTEIPASPELIPTHRKSIFPWIWCIIRTLWYWIERIFLIVFLLVLTVGLAWWLSQKPSLLRDWQDTDTILPTVSLSGNTISIQNIRNFSWSNDTEFTPDYYDAVYSLDDIIGMYYIITPFSSYDGPAHTMFSFSFSGGQNVVISAELRKEKGESFDAFLGMMNQYEIQYVIASESDVIKLRTNYRQNQVYMYPIKTEQTKIQALFRSMVLRADKLSRELEFYNTLWNNCTTSVLMHANAFRTEKLYAGILTLLPAHSDQLIYDAGLIDTSLPITEARAYYMISDAARNAGTGAIFSEVIRKEKR